jgi:hypothetical protein
MAAQIYLRRCERMLCLQRAHPVAALRHARCVHRSSTLKEPSMQTSKQVSSSDFVYLLHAAVQQPQPPEPLIAEGDEDEESEDGEDDEEENLKEINFDD